MVYSVKKMGIGVGGRGHREKMNRSIQKLDQASLAAISQSLPQRTKRSLGVGGYSVMTLGLGVEGLGG